MTKSNPFFICTRCRNEHNERIKNCSVTFDVMWLCNCPDEEEELLINKKKQADTIQFFSNLIESADMH